MNKKLLKTIELARALRPANVTGRNFHVTAVFSKSKVISIGFNHYGKSHPSKRIKFKYNAYKENNNDYQPCLHSEVSALLNLAEKDCSRFTFVNVRIDNSNKVNVAKPCPNCAALLKMVGFKSLFYTKNETEFEEIT